MSNKSAADICRENDWKPGQLILCKGIILEWAVQLTAIGRDSVLGICLGNRYLEGCGEEEWHQCKDAKESLCNVERSVAITCLPWANESKLETSDA